MERIERLFWSIALPGFGQLLNKQYVKGVLFVLLEVIINIESHFNKAIQLSFLGETKEAHMIIDYQWILFYPCLYFFAMWDAFKFAKETPPPPYSFLPFAFCAYIVTTGVFYAPKVHIDGIFFGPIWFPMICVLPGLIVGLLFQSLALLKKERRKKT